MTREEFDKLHLGQIIRHKGSGEAYQLDKISAQTHPNAFLGKREIIISNPSEWELIDSPSQPPLTTRAQITERVKRLPYAVVPVAFGIVMDALLYLLHRDEKEDKNA